MLGALRHAASLRFAAAGASLNARSGARLRLAWGELQSVAGLSIGAHGGPPRPRPRAARPPAHVQAAARAKEAQAPVRDREKERQVYKYFDEAVIKVKAGAGGDGEPLSNAKPKTVRNFKYQAGRQQRKFIELPVAAPADGAPGADVVLYVDPECDSLLHLRDRPTWSAKRGPSGAAAPPAVGDRKRARAALQPPALRIPVPPGTVVRRNRGRILLGDLVRPGQSLRVACGGRGGLGARASGGGPRAPRPRAAAGVETSVLEADDAAEATPGEPGEEVSLELLLRVVADVGIVGLPNAGKSSLLAALTRASPEVAPYPFTTLMPNLGVLAAGGDLRAQPAVLADLPGLIAGAHRGVGLGRAFLRHLRRTRCTLHVVDASAEDPATDYRVVREELRLYNPEYCARPFLVALNKTDAPGVAERLPQLRAQLEAPPADDDAAALGRPSGVFPVSALTGDGLADMLTGVEALIREANAAGGLEDDPELRLTEEEKAMIAAASR